MGKTILVIPDQHSHPEYHNDRADWAGRLILDLRPDIVVNMGDGTDMASLSSYDKGKRSFYGKSYAKDIESHLDFQDRLWHPIRHAKRRLPYSYYLEGNHEHRIEKVLDLSPELVGTVDVKDLEIGFYYDEFIGYDGGCPGLREIEGIIFAHYLVSGVKGLPISGTHPAYSIIAKGFKSAVVGHLHTTDYSCQTNNVGQRVQAIVAGVFQDYTSPWAGRQASQLWWPGLIVLHNVENGSYDPQWISMEALKKAYGTSGG